MTVETIGTREISWYILQLLKNEYELKTKLCGSLFHFDSYTRELTYVAKPHSKQGIIF